MTMFATAILAASIVLAPAAVPAAVPAEITIRAAATSAAAFDMKGYEPSLYTGKWYHPKWERTRKCIMDRESNFDYRAANRTSSARGAYQFLDLQWRDGLVWMLLPEARKNGLEAQAKALRNKPIHKWNRYWQDAAFYTAWRHGEGRKHWYYMGSLGC